jgi:peptidoglycan/LPS O-acetylase OafA/YrhL
VLSSKFFIRTNKLTYAIYLLNPIVFGLTFGLLENGGNVDPPLYFVMMIGLGLITYFLAIVFSLLFEIPFCKLSSEILKGSKRPALSVAPAAEERKCQ